MVFFSNQTFSHKFYTVRIIWRLLLILLHWFRFFTYCLIYVIQSFTFTLELGRFLCCIVCLILFGCSLNECLEGSPVNIVNRFLFCWNSCPVLLPYGSFIKVFPYLFPSIFSQCSLCFLLTQYLICQWFWYP